jgi:glycosyltransferase involved in cell wall biosynthesis
MIKLNNRKLLYLVATDSYFLSHRKALANATQSKGMHVVLASNFGKHKEQIEALGIETMQVQYNRKSFNPLQLTRTISRLIAITLQLRPDVIHAVALKPILLGLPSSFLTRRPFVATVTGLGLLYSRNSISFLLARRVMEFYLLILSKCAPVFFIFQNPDDQQLFASRGIANKRNSRIILSSGVDIEKYSPLNAPIERIRVLFPARMLWAKGVGYFAQAAKELREEFPNADFILAGAPDPDNRDSASSQDIEKWVRDCGIKWIGHQTDMVKVFQSSHLVVFPSYYREGVPLCLVEAAACGCAIITTNMPGCKEVVIEGWNGHIVPPHNQPDLTIALRKILSNPDKISEFGSNSRTRAVEMFAMSKINTETIACYAAALQ